MTVDEILGKIENRLTLDLEEISREIEGDIHAHQASAARLPERVKEMTEKMTKVQQNVDEVLLVQRYIITKIEAAMAYQRKYPDIFAPVESRQYLLSFHS